MSWHIASFVARSKAAAVKHIEEAHAKQKQYMPVEARDGLIACVETIHVPVGKGLLVCTANGHSDPHNGGNADVSLKTVDLID